MSQLGRPREAQVRRCERECKRHGITTWALRVHGDQVEWYCMKCHNEAQGHAPHQEMCATHGMTEHRTYVWADGHPRVVCMECRRESGRRSYHKDAAAKKLVAAVKRPVCPSCFVEMPNTGICDECS